VNVIKKKMGVRIFAAFGLIAAVAGANDPRGYDAREDRNAGPEPLTLAPNVASPAPRAEPPLHRNPLWAIPLKSLSATLERPLFSPSRRPPARSATAVQISPTKATATPDSGEPPLNLIGVVIGAEDGYAVFINTTTHDIVRLRTGEGHDGWILQSVKRRQVVLEKNRRTAVVALPQPRAEKK
jgi:general secretion pathway protein N